MAGRLYRTPASLRCYACSASIVAFSTDPPVSSGRITRRGSTASLIWPAEEKVGYRATTRRRTVSYIPLPSRPRGVKGRDIPERAGYFVFPILTARITFLLPRPPIQFQAITTPWRAARTLSAIVHACPLGFLGSEMPPGRDAIGEQGEEVSFIEGREPLAIAENHTLL